eukprot:COSAG06_NODE_9794_length_1814_cov_3.723615_3_plen_184_part_00
MVKSTHSFGCPKNGRPFYIKMNDLYHFYIKINDFYHFLYKNGRPFSLSHRECNVAVRGGAAVPRRHTVVVQTGKCSHNRVSKSCTNVSFSTTFQYVYPEPVLANIRGVVLDYKMAAKTSKSIYHFHQLNILKMYHFRTVPRDVAVNCRRANGRVSDDTRGRHTINPVLQQAAFIYKCIRIVSF